MSVFTTGITTIPGRRSPGRLLVVPLCILIIGFFTTPLQAQEWEDWLGLYADPDGQIPIIEVLPGIPAYGYFVLHIPSYIDEYISGVGFRVDNWPQSGALGVIGLDWLGGGWDGDIAEGIAVVTSIQGGPWEPDESGNVVIGVATFFSLDASWPGQDVRLEFRGRFPDSEFPIITDTWNDYKIGGDICWLNTYITATYAGTFSRLKMLY